MDTWGRIDGAVCLAGILRERMLFNMTEEEFDEVIRVHLKGTFAVYRNAAAIMRKQVVGNKIAVWSQPKEIRAMYTDERWTPEVIDERLMATVKLERLPFLDMVEEMKRAAAAKEAPNA